MGASSPLGVQPKRGSVEDVETFLAWFLIAAVLTYLGMKADARRADRAQRDDER